MEFYTNVRRGSIFTRFITMFLLIMAPIYLLGLSIYNWGLTMIEDEIAFSMSSQADYFLNTFESEIRRLKALQYECLYDENLLFLVNASEIMNIYEKTQAFLKLQNRLDVMKNSSIYIEDVYVYMPSIKKTVSANNGVTDNMEEIIKISKLTPDNLDSQIVYSENKLYLSIQYPTTSIFTQRPPRFILLSELSNKKIIDNLLTFNNHKGSASMLINYQQDYILTINQENDVAKHILKVNPIQKTQKNSQKKIKENIWKDTHEHTNDYTYENNIENVITTVKMGNTSYLIVNRKSDFLNMELITFTPEEQVFERIKKYQVLFIFFTAVSVIIMILFSFSTYRLMHKPLTTLVNSFKQLEKGAMNISIQHKHNDEFQYLYKSFNVMVTKLSGLIDQVYKQKIFAQRSELKQLQSQINPHFLYNSFFIIGKMAGLGDCENIKVFAEYLGSYYEFITRSSQDEVPLKNEVNHAKTYANIQAVRFSNRISVKFSELPDRYRDIMVPRLIIQPIIENAFEHGLKDKEEDGLIYVNFFPLSKGVCIVVEDNGESITDGDLVKLNAKLHNEIEIAESTGIINIHKRIQLRFGKDSGIIVKRSEIGGLRVELIIMFQDGGEVCV